MSKSELQPVVLPNPHLRGGELLLASMQGAKQALYAAHRADHRLTWWKSELGHWRGRIQDQIFRRTLYLAAMDHQPDLQPRVRALCDDRSCAIKAPHWHPIDGMTEVV